MYKAYTIGTPAAHAQPHTCREARQSACQQAYEAMLQPVSWGSVLRCVDSRPGCAQVWLQEFAWTVEEKEEKFRKRAADGRVGAQLANEPMFCFGDLPASHTSASWAVIHLDSGGFAAWGTARKQKAC